MTEERLEPAENQNKAINIVQILMTFECPKIPTEFPEWLQKIKFLQTFLSKLWQDDGTGKIMVECLNVLYDVIALNQTPVSPAVWSVLDLVEEDKINEIVEGILNDPNTNDDSKVQNALVAIVDGLCQYGPQAHRLQDWALALIQGLAVRKNFSILTAVAECTIVKLTLALLMPLFRPLIYPVFRLFLYSVVTPHVFYKILDSVPKVIMKLDQESDEDTRICLNDFAGILGKLLIRFPPKPTAEAKYNEIRLALMGLPEVAFAPESLTLWDPDDNSEAYSWRTQPILPDFYAASQTPYKGLINQGNTCFMNSVLQILYMTTRFRNEMLMKEVDPSERAASDLQQLFAFMQESNRTVLVPNGVIDSTLPPTFRRGHQQDSSEYLIYLLDTIHEGENKIIRRRKQGSSPFKNSADRKMDGNGDFEEGAASAKETEENENTIVERLFGGVTMSTTVCSFCKKSFPKNDSFRDLHLSLPDDQKSCDLQELINFSLEPEELCSDNMYDCSNCGTKRNASRKQAIIKAPEHLILTLKLFRFDPVRKQRLKLHSRLKNAKTVELPVYNSSQLATKVVTYDVKGVVLHSGASLDGGHYFSSAVDQSGQWYLFNDSVVSVAKCEWNGGGGTPYILVLRQSDVTDPPKNVLPTNLQQIVNRDNQKYLAERRYQQRVTDKKKEYDDDYDDTPPNGGSLGGSGPSLVF